MAASSREHLRGQNVLTVAAFYWQDRSRQRQYQITPEDVRIWDSMVARHLTIPHRRVCVTHRPDLIDFMETVPLDMAKHVPGLCTVKLQAHKPGGVAEEGDRVLLMDIDMVAVDCLDPIVMRDEHAVWWKNPNFEVGGKRGFIQGSMQLFTVGATTHLWADFDPRRTPAMLNRRFGGGEQAWISERLNTAWPEPGWEWNEFFWTEADGVYGAGRLVNGRMGEGVQSELPWNARIVFTPGDRSPSQPEMVAKHPWIAEHYR
jgi:hypothetical protein